MEINIGEIMDGLINMDPSAVMNDKSMPVMTAAIVTAVLALLMCFLGLKLIRIWNVLIGLLAGAAAGLAASWALNLENGTAVIVILGAAILLAVFGGIFKKFGVFVYTLASIFFIAAAIIQPENWIFVAVCGGIGLIVAIIAMLVFEPLVIIVTSINGGTGIGTAVGVLTGLSNPYIIFGIIVVVALIGISVQFAIRYKEISKKEVRHAEEIKEEISKAQEVEHLRTLLDEEED